MNKIILIISLALTFSCNIKSQVESTDISLKDFELILNESIPEYRNYNDKGFTSLNNEIPIGYFVFDLTDVSNVSKRSPEDEGESIKFYEGHYYHFAPVIMSISYSHIAYIEDDELKVFKSINCKDKGDNLLSVQMFAQNKKSNSDVMMRIDNYRKYGRYYIEDNYGMSVNCDCDPCE
tara:strand:+ start:389 stop:922 length:534 start_codon:yes stop_codon:yes gene_type:complete